MSRRKMPRPAGYHWDAKLPVVRPDGRKPCRWCKGPVAKGKRNWCIKPECVEEWTRRTSWALTRAVVYRRDLGVCALCGFDTGTVDAGRLLARLKAAYHGRPDGPQTPEERRALAELVEAAYRWQQAHKCVARDPWEVDHIVPVSAGGDFFDLSNLRTLCVPCHKAVTREYNAGRTAERRRAKAMQKAR